MANGSINIRNRTLTVPEVILALGLGSQDMLDKLIADGKFPQGFTVSGNTRLWWEADVYAYLHLRSRMAGAPPTPKPGKGQQQPQPSGGESDDG